MSLCFLLHKEFAEQSFSVRQAFENDESQENLEKDEGTSTLPLPPSGAWRSVPRWGAR